MICYAKIAEHFSGPIVCLSPLNVFLPLNNIWTKYGIAEMHPALNVFIDYKRLKHCSSHLKHWDFNSSKSLFVSVRCFACLALSAIYNI